MHLVHRKAHHCPADPPPHVRRGHADGLHAAHDRAVLDADGNRVGWLYAQGLVGGAPHQHGKARGGVVVVVDAQRPQMRVRVVLEPHPQGFVRATASRAPGLVLGHPSAVGRFLLPVCCSVHTDWRWPGSHK